MAERVVKFSEWLTQTSKWLTHQFERVHRRTEWVIKVFEWLTRTDEQLTYPGLSLRGGGRGFPPATMNVVPGYFQRKIEEK